MTAIDKSGKAISQAVKILINGGEYTAEELRKIVAGRECNNCSKSPENNGGVFHLDCGECCRFYDDRFSKK